MVSVEGFEPPWLYAFGPKPNPIPDYGLHAVKIVVILLYDVYKSLNNFDNVT